MKKRLSGLAILVIFLLVIVLDIGGGLMIVNDWQAHLSLLGPEKVELRLGEAYEDYGVTAKMKGDNVLERVEMESDLDTETPGEYTITYKLGIFSVTREITVGEVMDPVIELEQGDEEVLLAEEYPEPGYVAYSSDGTDLTGSVEIDTTELNEAGERKIYYTVSDSEGNKTRISRTVEVLPNTEYDTPGLPICMYHYVYDENDPPEDLERRYANYIEKEDLREELMWLKEEGYYFPTWEEVRKYVDGELLLPEKSIVLCFDDGVESFLEVGIPVLEQCHVPATCFIVTTWDGKSKIKKYESDYVTFQSHSHNMHRPGGTIGHGGIFTALSREDSLDDLNKSIDICGSGEAFAYPFGDYTDECKSYVEEAGFLCAVTTVNAKAYPGMDPYELPRVRMSNGQSMEHFQYIVSPR